MLFNGLGGEQGKINKMHVLFKKNNIGIDKI